MRALKEVGWSIAKTKTPRARTYYFERATRRTEWKLPPELAAHLAAARGAHAAASANAYEPAAQDS